MTVVVQKAVKKVAGAVSKNPPAPAPAAAPVKPISKTVAASAAPPPTLTPPAAAAAPTKAVVEDTPSSLALGGPQWAIGKTSTTHPDGSSTETQQKVEGVPGAPNLASVSVSMGLTRNLGNYEAVKFHVELSVPCDPTAEAVEAAYEQALAWVDSKVSAIDAEVKTTIG